MLNYQRVGYVNIHARSISAPLPASLATSKPQFFFNTQMTAHGWLEYPRTISNFHSMPTSKNIMKYPQVELEVVRVEFLHLTTSVSEISSRSCLPGSRCLLSSVKVWNPTSSVSLVVGTSLRSMDIDMDIIYRYIYIYMCVCLYICIYICVYIYIQYCTLLHSNIPLQSYHVISPSNEELVHRLR